MKNVSVINFRENQNPYFVFNIFFKENRAIYEIMWKNILEPDEPYMTIWRIRIACCVPKSTNTHSDYLTLVSFSTTTVFALTRHIVTSYLHCLSC